MITLRILLSPGRRGRIVDASGRAVPQPLPAPVIGSAEPLRIILLDPSTLDPADPYGFDTGAPLRLTISGDWDPATIPVYATNALERTGVGTYDLADPSGTRTAEALALLGVLAERLCAWELVAYGGNPETEADWAHPLSVVQFDAPLRQRADSLGGDPAEAPSVDLRGPPGPPGQGGDPYDSDPAMDGTASPGTSRKYARGDHVHPVDPSRAPVDSPAFTGTPTAPTAAAGTNTTQVATTAFVVSTVDRFANTSVYASSDPPWLMPGIAVYRAYASGGVLPEIDATNIPTNRNAYFDFELEVEIPYNATVIDSTNWSTWTWLDGGGLPTATEAAGKTIYVAARLDCTTRAVLANCWRVA